MDMCIQRGVPAALLSEKKHLVLTSKEAGRLWIELRQQEKSQHILTLQL
jgi:hypothetical protein